MFDPNLALGGLSAAFGAFSGIGAAKRQKKAIVAQQRENEIARSFNRAMAEQANRWSREAVADERAYNDPSAVRARLQKAGLNPDLMYGNGAGSLIDSNVAQTFQSSGYSPTDISSSIMQTPTISDSIINGISAAKMFAETKKINTETEKEKGLITSLDLDNMIKAASSGATIEQANMQVSLSKSVIGLNEAQKESLLQGLKNLETANAKMNAEIDEIKAHTASLDATTLNTRLETLLSGKRFALEVQRVRQELKESDSRIDVNVSQVKRAMLLMLSEKLNLDADTLFKKANYHKTNVDTENAILSQDIITYSGKSLMFHYNQDEKFGNIERTLGTARIISDGVANVIGSLNPLKGLLAPGPAPIRGFGR